MAGRPGRRRAGDGRNTGIDIALSAEAVVTLFVSGCGFPRRAAVRAASVR